MPLYKIRISLLTFSGLFGAWLSNVVCDQSNSKAHYLLYLCTSVCVCVCSESWPAGGGSTSGYYITSSALSALFSSPPSLKAGLTAPLLFIIICGTDWSSSVTHTHSVNEWGSMKAAAGHAYFFYIKPHSRLITSALSGDFWVEDGTQSLG